MLADRMIHLPALEFVRFSFSDPSFSLFFIFNAYQFWTSRGWIFMGFTAAKLRYRRAGSPESRSLRESRGRIGEGSSEDEGLIAAKQPARLAHSFFSFSIIDFFFFILSPRKFIPPTFCLPYVPTAESLA